MAVNPSSLGPGREFYSGRISKRVPDIKQEHDVPSRTLQSDTPTPSTPSQRTNPTSQGKTILASAKRLLTGDDLDNSVYSAAMSQEVIKLDEIEDEEEKKKAIVENAVRAIRRTQKVIDLGYENIEAGRDPWYGINRLKEDEKLPVSSRMQRLNGNPSRQQYNQNKFVNHLARAVLASILNDAEIVFNIDVDATIDDKLVAHSTQMFKTAEHVYEFNQTIYSAADHLGIKIFTNTNRPPHEVRNGVRGFGLDTDLIESVHTSPYQAFGGLSRKNQIEISKRVGITAGSAAYRHVPGEDTRFSYQTLIVADFFKMFQQEIDKHILDLDAEYEPVIIEPKCFNHFSLDNLRISNAKKGTIDSAPTDKTVYDPLILQIIDFREECTEGDLPTQYENFKQKLLAHLEEGERMIPEYKRQREEIKETIESLVSTNENGVNDKEIKKLNEEIHNLNISIRSYVRLIGYKNETDTYFTYEDSFGNEQQCFNYYKLLIRDPQGFFEEVTRGELQAYCVHNRDSNNIPHPDFVDYGIKFWEHLENMEGAREHIRQAQYRTAQEYTKRQNRGNVDSPSGKKLQHPVNHINYYVADGRKVLEEEGVIKYLNWRLCRYIELHCEKENLSSSTIFENKVDKESKKEFLAVRDDFLQKLQVNSNGDVKEYINQLKEELGKAGEKETKFAKFVESAFNDKYLSDISSNDPSRVDEALFPDWLFCINYGLKYTKDTPTYAALISLEDKRSKLKPWGTDPYLEALQDLLKALGLATVGESIEGKKIQFYFGDSPSDLPPQNRALHCSFKIGDEWISGGAVKVYKKISKDDHINRAIAKRTRNVREAIEERYSGDFSKDYEGAGIYGLERVQGGYRKIVDVQARKAIPLDDKIYSEEEIRKEMWNFLASRIYERDNVAENVRGLAEALAWLTGADIDLSEKELEQARGLKGVVNLTGEQEKLVKKCEFPLDELERSKYLPTGMPHNSVYFEYCDPSSGEKYYKLESDRTLSTKGGKHFTGDKQTLTRRAIIRTAIGDEYAVYVYEDTRERFQDPRFLNNCLIEQKFLPGLSPIKGIFANKFITGIVGEDNLRKLITKLPNIFSSTLATCGGLLTLGGFIRLGSKLTGGGEDSSIYTFGYWMSQIVRASSAFAGACRGLLNVNKYYSITIGEFINIFSALFLRNGAKQVGFALGNGSLLTGRGIQNAQRALSSNVLPKEEVDKNDYIEGNLDPRPFQIDVTKFNSEQIMLPIKKAVEKAGLPAFIGNFVGSTAGSILTTFHMMKQVLKNPKLIFQVKKRVSDKSGNACYSIPSVAHLFSLSGVLGGIGAITAMTVGRIERFGEVAESGFNKIGRFATSFGMAIQSLPIIANGLEIAANQNGLPRETRGTDGRTIKYSPERAGYGQVFAGVMYGGLSWFDLSKDWASSLLDALAIGPYFGFPGMKVSVAEEEKMNSLELAKNMLFESDKFFIKKKKEEILFPKLQARQELVRPAA